MKRLLWTAAACALLLAGCGTSAAQQLGQALHMTVYLPKTLPQGLRYADGKKIGKAMVYLHYTSAHGRQAVVLFESPDPISPPPGATQAKDGTWVAVSETRGETVRSLLVQRKDAYVEVVATGLTQAQMDAVQGSLTRYAP